MKKFQVVNKDTKTVEVEIEATSLQEAENIAFRNRDNRNYSVMEVLLG